MNILEARRRTLGGHILKKTAQGNPAIATDSLARMYPGIEMQGWTEQDSTTGAQLFDIRTSRIGAISRVTGQILDYGADWLASDYIPVISGGQYSCTYAANYGDTGYAFYDELKVFLSGVPCTKNFTVPESAVFCRITVNVSDYDSNIFMLNAGSTALPYEPYTGGQPSPSPEYPQKIVSAGTKNQENGKWEYEITITNAQTGPDKNQTVTLTADRPLTKWDRLEKRGGQWGWVYKSAEAVFDGSEEWSLYPVGSVGTVFLTALPNTSVGLQTSLCDKYRNIDYAWDAVYDGVFGIYSDHAVATNKYFRPPSAAVETVEQWKVWLSENPLTLWYETEVETFVPLTASEQEAMNALYTYRPTTVLSNQQDCEMALTYKTRKSMEVTA